VFLRARAALRSHCARPSQTRLFTEIMRILENTSTFVSAVNLIEVWFAVKDEGRGFDLNKLADPTLPRISKPFMAVGFT